MPAQRPKSVITDFKCVGTPFVGVPKFMEFDVRVYQCEDFLWCAECPDIPNCVSKGATEEEALRNIEETIKDTYKVRAELGLPPFVHHRMIRLA